MPLKRIVIVLTLTLWMSAQCVFGETTGQRADFFHDRVEPILIGRCLACHGSERKGELDLRSEATALVGGESGTCIEPGSPEESLLIEYVASEQMPPEEPLTADEIAVLKQWISEGAFFPSEPLDPFSKTTDHRAGFDWWSLRPLAVVAPPTPEGLPAAWSENPIDRFIYAKLVEKGLQPSAAAEPRTLVRRVTYDVIGLPPTPEEVDAFILECREESGSENQVGNQAYERLVDRLLASAHYGEQWGRHWLDVVRFGESRGFERNEIINNAWPFRDYVINALNEDKPFDQMAREHLAGDLVGKGDPQVEIGAAFLVSGPFDDVINQDVAQAAQIRANTIDEIIRATSETFLGLTVGCARCHDHKFDPISQQDYYRLYSTFSGIFHGSRTVATDEQRSELEAKQKPLQALEKEITKQIADLEKAISAREENTDDERQQLSQLRLEQEKVKGQLAALPGLPDWWVGLPQQPKTATHVFLGGNPQRKGDPVVPASLAVLSKVIGPYELDDKTPEGKRREALAEWIVDSENPLTPRVLVNRLWHYHFGTGIVDTPSDFGYMGGRPTHPALLDWLAKKIRAEAWHVKPVHKLILLSQTYRQSSAMDPEAARIDSDARLLWRFPPRRLTSDEIRDSMLAVTGKLNRQLGGPGFRLYRYMQDNVATYVPLDHHGPETYRRSVYHQNARAMQVDLMTEYDSPDCAFPAPRRSSTTTPLQALTLMNHSFTIHMASALSERVAREAGSDDPAAIVQQAFALMVSRPCEAEELAITLRFIEAHGLQAFYRAMFNMNEFVYLN